MKGKHKHTPEFKLQVALEALKGLKTVGEANWPVTTKFIRARFISGRNSSGKTAGRFLLKGVNDEGKTPRRCKRRFTKRSAGSNLSWTG
jgi:hypothetical protein